MRSVFNARGLAGWMFASALLAGCSLCQMATLKLDEPFPGPVRGRAYLPFGADRHSVVFHELGFDTRDAPPFVVIFPDGHHANIQNIDRRVIEEHLGPFTLDESGNLRAYYEGPAESGHLRIGAHLGNDGQPYSMWLESSGPTKNVFATADDTEAFGFPLTEDEFHRLVKRPVRVGWEPVGTLYGECHD